MAASPETQSLKGPGLAAALAAAVAWVTPGGQPLAAFLTTFALSYGLQAWSMKEARKRSLEDRAEARQTIRSAVAPHRIIYGEAVVGGVMVYAEVTGSEKEYLHSIVTLAGHEITSVGFQWINDERVSRSGVSGDVASGTYSGLARFQYVTGTTSQAAFADLVSASGGNWTSAHQGKGIAAMYARLKWDQDKFLGIPQITVQVRGKACYDPRDGVTRYTQNPALILRDYLRADYGLACTNLQIDDAAVEAAADICDEWVALDTGVVLYVTADATANTFTTKDSGYATTVPEVRIQTGDRVNLVASSSVPSPLTAGADYYVIRIDASTFQLAASHQNALEGAALDITTTGSGVRFQDIDQKRYAMSGTFSLDQSPRDVIEDMLATMAGSLVWTQGVWVMSAGAAVATTATLTEADLRGGYAFRHKRPKADRTDAIRGSYAEPGRQYVLSDYPRVTSGTADYERVLDMPFVTSAFRCQRIAKIALAKAGAARLALPCKISALAIRPTDTIAVSLDGVGLAADTYRVVSWTLSGEDGGIGVDLELEADDAAHYAWSASDGVAPPLHDPLVLPDAVSVQAPSGLSAASGTAELIAAGDGTIISRIRVSWTAAAEPNITGYELQWKLSTESTYNAVYLPKDGTQYYLGPVQDGATYNLRARTLATPGSRRSDWITNSHTVTGKTAAPTAPSSLGVTGLPNAFQISWSACPDADYAETEVWEATTNNRSGASQVATLKGNALTRSGFSAGAVRYLWVRHKDTSANVSDWYPSSATGGVTATAGADAGNAITHDFTGFMAGGATGYLTGTGYWLGYSSGYKMHLGNPSGAHIKWDGSTLTIKGSTVTGDLQVDTGGNVRGGQTGYNTGTGFWIGYTGGVYKFSIGSPSGNRLTWDGSALTVVGTINGIGQYAAGTTVTLALAGTERNSASSSYSKVKEIIVPKSGTVRCTWNMKTFLGTTGYSRVYVNGVATGTEKSTTSTTNVAQSDDITVNGGDLVQLYYRNDPGSGNGTFVSSFAVNATVPEASTVLVD